jgi:beta-fructofuranosidase
MAFALADKWVWDFWFARNGDDVHMFFLQAPRSLGDPERRHRNARIGHAVSQDLVNWSVLSDAFPAGDAGDFDDIATWTGSVLRHGDTWYMFYTGVSTNEDGYVQRINYATSPDLITWTKSGAPALEADPAFYEKLAGSTEIEESFRDPWVFADEDGNGFHMFMTARVPGGEGNGRGVVGYAWSSDLHHWEQRPAITQPGQWVGLEVPQLAKLGNQWRVFYSTQERWASEVRKANAEASLATGSYYMSAPTPFGPYNEDLATSLVVGAPLYSGRVIEHQGEWFMLGFLGDDELGVFAGTISDPVAIHVDENDALVARLSASIE